MNQQTFIIMKIQETEEYRLVKQLTSEENRKAVLNAAWQVPLTMGVLYASMYGFMYFFLWLVKL